MSTIQQLVDQLNTATPSANWKVVGSGMPVEETAPISVAAQPADLSDPTSQATPATTVNRGTGRYFVTVQDGEGHQRAMFLKPDPIMTGAAANQPSDIQVKQSGVNDADPSKVFSGDLSKLSWQSGGPIGDVPQGTKQPTATAKLDQLNSRGQVIPPGTPYDANNPDTKPVQMRDAATGTTFNVNTDPAGTLHDLGDDVILVKPDGSYTKVATKPKEPTQINVPNVGLVDYDPSKPEGQRANVLIKAPDQSAPTTEVRDGITYQYDKASQTWIKTDLPPDVQIGYTYNDPQSDQIIFYDKSGKEVNRTTKPNYKPPVQVQPGTAPAADQVSAVIPTFNPQTGALEFVPNQNQQKASEATSQLAQQLGVKVAAGSMSEKQAQDIITGAVNTMNAQTQRMTAEASQQQNVTTAAGDVLSNTRGNAQTGAGLLQQRVQAATGTLQSILGNALQNKNITSVPGDVGANLVGGLQGWTADLMGGQSTLDSAARMVQAADPQSNMADPTTQAAVATLHQMLDKYQDVTGQAHPIVQATQAANASQQNGGMAAPNTFNPQGSTAALNAGGYQDTPQGRAAAAAAAPGLLATPATQATPAVAAGFQAPPIYGAGPPAGANYGNGVAYTGGVPPWLAGPQPAFMAPVTG